MSFFSFLKPIEHDVAQAASGTFNFLKSTAVGTINTAKNTADIVNAGRQGAQGLIQAGTAALTHNPVAEQNAIRKTNQAVDYSLNASRGALTPQEAQSGDIVKPIIRNAAAIAPLVLPFGKIAAGASLPVRTLAKGGANAAVAGGANAATQLADTGHINPGEVAQNAAVGGVLGAAGEVVPAAVKARISPVHAHYEIGKNVTEENSIHIPVGDQGTLTVKLSELQSLAKAKTPEEVKGIIGDSLPKNVVDQITPAIAQTKDPHIISNILQKGAESTLPHPQPTISELGGNRPNNDIQTAIEQAHNAGNTGRVNDLINQLPLEHQPAMRSALGIPERASISDTLPTSQPRNSTLGFLKSPESDSQLIVDALKGTEQLGAKQEALYSAERGARAGQATAAGSDLPGTAGYKAELSRLRGPLEKVKYSGLSDKLPPAEQEGLFTRMRGDLQQKGLDYYTYLNTQTALRKVIFGEGLPTTSERALLRNQYGEDFAKAVEDNVALHQKALTKLQQAGQIAGLPRELVASGDVSGLGRQALAAFVAHPITVGKNFINQFKFYSGKNFEASQRELASRPNYGRAVQAKLAVLDPSSKLPDETEEKFLSSLGERIPVLGKFIKASNQSFTGTLNRVRMDLFDQLVQKADDAGYNIDDQKIIKDLAKAINNGTGRGEYGEFLEKHAGALSTVFFSPRLMASRLRVFDPTYYAGLSAPARKEAFRQLAGLGTFATGILGLAKMAGADVSTDPTNADFGKVKVGDTRLDFLGGYQQYIRLGAQLAEGKITSSTTGHVTTLGPGFGGKTAYDVLLNFFQNKENPTASFITTELKGTDIAGNNVRTPSGVGSQLLQRVIPLAYQDINDLFAHPNAFKGNLAGKIAGGAADLAGVGLQTYGKEDLQVSPSQKKYIQYLNSTGATQNNIKGVTDFFQTLKTGPDKKITYQQIDAAIKAKDGQKLEKLVDDYNQQLQATVKPWADKYGQYGNEDLQKYYDSLKITDNAVQQRIQSAQDTKPKL